MYPEHVLERYAEVLLWGLSEARGPLRKSELVLVRYDLGALPLAEALVGMLHEAGQVPVPKAQPTPRMERDLYLHANNKRLTLEIPGELELAHKLGAAINLLAPGALGHLSDIEPERFTRRRAAHKRVQQALREREAQGEYGWTLCLYPTQAMADQAGMGLPEYADRLKRACLLHKPDPAREWRALCRKAREIAAWLTDLPVDRLRVESDDTELSLRVGDERKWVGISGRNIPSFELYVSPDWRATEGVYLADLPSLTQGNLVKRVRLQFRHGKVVGLTAEQGRDFALEQIGTDQGARQVGEFALVDKRFSPIDAFMANTLLDENHGGEHGSCHIALGNSYANCFAGDPTELTGERKKELGFNVSDLHWDLVNTADKRVTALLRGGGRQVIYEGGRFLD